MCSEHGHKPGSPEYRAEWLERRHAQMTARISEMNAQMNVANNRAETAERALSEAQQEIEDVRAVNEAVYSQNVALLKSTANERAAAKRERDDLRAALERIAALPVGDETSRTAMVVDIARAALGEA